MSLELKKIQVELMRVQTAKMELEYKIEEKLDEVRRMQEHITIQEAKELELKEKIQELKK